jgi:hypothetical protein
VGASEGDEWLRAAWRTLVAGAIDTNRLVFVDEMGANTSLCPLYAYSLRGRRVHAEVPRNRGKNTTLLASMSLEGMGLCLRWKAPPPLGFSRLTLSKCSPRA